MPNIKNPFDTLQIEIPGMKKFTEARKCENDESKLCVNWIAEYIAGIYNYAIGIVGILATVVLMVGGIVWLTAGGNPTRIGEAKAYIGASLSGLIIALSSYMILYQVNPKLVGFSGLRMEIVIPAPADGKAFAEKCKPTDSGPCAVANMSGFGNRAKQASAICMAESGGVAAIKNVTTKCSNGDYYAVWGLFQFNLSANRFDNGSEVLDCPSAFGNKAWVNSSPNCTVTDPILYQKCVTAASTAALSIMNAQKLVSAKSWGPWEANSKWCKFEEGSDDSTIVTP